MSKLQNDTKNILSQKIQKQFLTQIRNEEIQKNLRSSYVNITVRIEVKIINFNIILQQICQKIIQFYSMEQMKL